MNSVFPISISPLIGRPGTNTRLAGIGRQQLNKEVQKGVTSLLKNQLSSFGTYLTSPQTVSYQTVKIAITASLNVEKIKRDLASKTA